MIWTDADIQDWLETLGQTHDEQFAMLRHLLLNQRRDRMSREDQEVCKRALQLLAGERRRPAR